MQFFSQLVVYVEVIFYEFCFFLSSALYNHLT